MTFVSEPQFHIAHLLKMKVQEGAFNQEKALVGAFSVIVQPVVEPMDRFAALGESLVMVATDHW